MNKSMDLDMQVVCFYTQKTLENQPDLLDLMHVQSSSRIHDRHAKLSNPFLLVENEIRRKHHLHNSFRKKNNSKFNMEITASSTRSLRHQGDNCKHWKLERPPKLMD